MIEKRYIEATASYEAMLREKTGNDDLLDADYVYDDKGVSGRK